MIATALPPLRFLVPGRPVPKARARMGWAWGARRRVWYTPPSTREYAKRVALYAKRARSDWECAHGRAWPRNGVRYSLAVEVRTRGRPRADADNYLKQVADALQGVLWDNDRSVAEAQVLKVPAPDDSMEALEVTVHALGPVR